MSACEITGFGTHLKVASIEKSRTFYESLGFKLVFGYGDEAFRASLPDGVASAPEKYRGLTFEISDSANFEIAEDHIAIKDKSVSSLKIHTPKISAMVRVKSLVPLFENPNITISFPVRKYYWGTIEAAFRDPDGYVLVFIAPFSDKELAAVEKHVDVEEVKP